MVKIFELLTLAISETENNKYKIVSYSLNENKFYTLKINYHEFYIKYDEPLWNLFGITKVENLIHVNTENNKSKIYLPGGLTRFDGYKGKRRIKSFFRRKKEIYDIFRESNKNYTIIKIENIKSLPLNKNDSFKKIPRIKVSYKNKHREYDTKNFLVKDYKWVNYWKTLPQEEIISKINKWYTYFNKIDKQIYAVLYRHNFSDNKNIWICGLHCL